MIDILEALAGESRGTESACRIQRWLDSIPSDAPGKDALVAAFTTTDPEADGYRSLQQLVRVAKTLGFTTSDNTIGHHRRKACSCVG